MMEIVTPACGDKSHIEADRRFRFIRKWTVTDAARYDGREPDGPPGSCSDASRPGPRVNRSVFAGG